MNSQTVNQWERMPDIPNSFGKDRRGHSMVAYGYSLYIFGGMVNDGYENDLLQFDLDKNRWYRLGKTAGIPPSPRYGHAAVVYQSSMFIFGGKDHTGYKNDVFEYQFGTREWKEWEFEGNNLPQGRVKPGAVVYADKLWIFHGQDGFNGLNNIIDSWSFSLTGSKHQWQRVEIRTNESDKSPIQITDYTAVAVARDHLFTLIPDKVQNKDMKSLYKFSFEERTWIHLKHASILMYKEQKTTRRADGAHGIVPMSLPTQCPWYSTVNAFHDQLLITDGPDILHCFDLDSEILSVVKLTSDQNFASCIFPPFAAVIEDAMYISYYPCKLYKFQFTSVYRKCTLRDDYKKIWENKLFCDVVFVVGKGQVRFPAHSAIILARSEWLKEYILNYQSGIMMKNTRIRKFTYLMEITLPDQNPDAFHIILSYIYTDQIEPCTNARISLDVYKLAGEIRLERLQHLISQQLSEQFSCWRPTNSGNDLEVFYLKFINEGYEIEVTGTGKKDFYYDILVKALESFDRRKRPMGISSQHGTSDLIIHTLEADMKVFMESELRELSSDVTLVVGEYKIPAQRYILAGRCRYFEAMFRPDHVPWPSKFRTLNGKVSIQIGEVAPSKEAFDTLLKYIYYGDCINLPALEHSAQVAAAIFGFTNKRFLSAFKTNLRKFGTLEKFIEVLQAADTAQELDLKEFALMLIVDGIHHFEGWPRTPLLSQELLMDVLNEIISRSGRSVDRLRLAALRDGPGPDF